MKQYRGKQGDPSGGSEIPKQREVSSWEEPTAQMLSWEKGRGASPAPWEWQVGTVSGVITQMV